MSKVKFCGLRRPADIHCANRLRPDYVGFVFAPGRRRVTPEEAGRLRALLDPAIAAVGVFVNEDPAVIAGLLAAGIIDAVQLHGDEDEAFVARVKALSPRFVLKAVRVGDRLPPLPRGADLLLFDTLSQGARGGTGRTFDWELLRPVRQPYFLAGGLTAQNLEQAIATLSPYCVDLSSGVETDGWKDPDKMEQVIRLVRSVNKDG